MKIGVPLILLVLALAACGGAAAGSPASGAKPAAAATAATVQASPAAPAVAAATPKPASVTVAELDAVARRIFPGAHPAGCGDLATCPVTDRLRARVEQLSQPPAIGPGPVAQFCRCQNGAAGMTVTSEAGESGGVAHVVLDYGAGFRSRIDLIIVRQPDSRLLLDDTQCTGRGAGTSLYAATMAACGT
jgi:hypothetical protein